MKEIEEEIEFLNEETILKMYDDIVESGQNVLIAKCNYGFWYGAIICKP